MSAGRWITAAAIVILTGALAWVLFVTLPSWYGEPSPSAHVPEAAEAAPTPAPAPRIKAKLFFVAEDGVRLVPVEREVLAGRGVAEQARRLLDAQLETPPAPLVSAIPAGTTLRAIYLLDGGRAVVDLSRELASAHPGGSLNEQLTVATLVDALIVNLPSITEVRILVDGRETDSLAGHVDLRRSWTRRAVWTGPALADQSTGDPGTAGPARF